MIYAITRSISPAFNKCELTHLERIPIDLELANLQHKAYEKCLADLGCQIYQLPMEPELADSVFVEDTAIVFNELAIITRPGAISRRQETLSIANALKSYRKLYHIEAPATIDGGDVLLVGKKVFIGLSLRTNTQAIEQIKEILSDYGYSVITAPVDNCLHFKSAVTVVSDNTLLINPDWVDRKVFGEMDIIEVDPTEPSAANALLIGDSVIFPSNYPKTNSILQKRGIRTKCLDISEVIKAEGAVTCCSLIFNN